MSRLFADSLFAHPLPPSLRVFVSYPGNALAHTGDTVNLENIREEQRREISLEIASVERAMQRTQLAIHNNRVALQPDAFGRVPGTMPPSLEAAYESIKVSIRSPSISTNAYSKRKKGLLTSSLLGQLRRSLC